MQSQTHVERHEPHLKTLVQRTLPAKNVQSSQYIELARSPGCLFTYFLKGTLIPVWLRALCNKTQFLQSAQRKRAPGPAAQVAPADAREGVDVLRPLPRGDRAHHEELENQIRHLRFAGVLLTVHGNYCAWMKLQ